MASVKKKIAKQKKSGGQEVPASELKRPSLEAAAADVDGDRAENTATTKKCKVKKQSTKSATHSNTNDAASLERPGEVPSPPIVVDVPTVVADPVHALRVPNTPEQKKSGDRVIVVLEKAALELVFVKGVYQLLNVDDHKSVLAKNQRDMTNVRPDITHQCLLSLLDSPLNKAGRLLVYIHTASNVLIEINPQLRVPRTFRRFCGLMVELLQRHKIRAAGSSDILLKVISNPITKYLPDGGRKIGFSVNGRLVNFRQYAAKIVEDTTTHVAPVPTTFVVGAVAHGDPIQDAGFGADYVEESISVSNWGLSAACCCAKICNEFEHEWGVL